MSLLSALYTGVSGLQSFGESLQVIGDNISNVNTVGFKSSRAEFADLLSQSMGGSGRGQIGRGVTMQRVTKSFAQGSFSNTDRLTDLAVNGNGFFMVGDGSRQFYTRNGQFTINTDGELVTAGGYQLLGFQYDPAGLAPINNLVPINIGTGSTQPNQTGNGTAPAGSGVNIRLNLNSQTGINATPFSVADPAGTSDFNTAVTVYDEIGEAHSMSVYFKKTADNTWAWHSLIDGGELSGGTAGTPVEGGTGTLSFTAAGAFNTATGTTATFNFTGNAQTVGMNFGSTIADGTDGLGGTTQFANPNVIHSQTQDGFAAGNLASLTISQDGIISGIYTNGRTIPIAQIRLASFLNNQGLFNAGSGLYNETGESGAPIVGNPNSGTLGTVSAFSLELSNVDLATEFVNLISTQRAYQANTKIITTGDQLLSEVVNLVR